MPEDNILVGARTPIPITASTASKVRVTKGVGATVYYKNESNVSSVSNDGSLTTTGQSETFTAPTWFISTAVKAKLFVEHIPSPNTDMATQAELEEAEAIVAAKKVTELADTKGLGWSVSAQGGLTLTPTSGAAAALRLVQSPNGGISTLELDSTPAEKEGTKTPSVKFLKGSSWKWDLGIDVAAGAQGDFYIRSQTASADILYITDEANPGVGIGAVDRTAAKSSQLKIVNSLKTRAALVVAHPAKAEAPCMYLLAGTEQTGAFLECRDGVNALKLSIGIDGALAATGLTFAAAANEIRWPGGGNLYEISAEKLATDKNLQVITQLQAGMMVVSKTMFGVFSKEAAQQEGGSLEKVEAALKAYGLIK